MCGPTVARLWADPNLGLMRFGALRRLTLSELPALGSLWMPRLPESLQSLTIAVPPRDKQASVPDNRSGLSLACVTRRKPRGGGVHQQGYLAHRQLPNTPAGMTVYC